MVENGLEYEDLMENTEARLQGMLEEIYDDEYIKQSKANKWVVARIISAVQKDSNSLIHKEFNNAKVSVVSSEEHEMAQRVQQASARMSAAVSDTASVMESLDANSQSVEKQIDVQFAEIIARVTKRKEQLVQQLKNVTDSKRSQLKTQQAQFAECLKGLDAFYAETQSMMKDAEYDPTKRKFKIVSEGKTVLSSAEVDVKPATNDKIVLNIDLDAVTDVLARIGAVMDGNGALPPTVK